MAVDSLAAFFSLTQAEYATTGNFKQKVAAEGSMMARIRVNSSAGATVTIPLSFTLWMDKSHLTDKEEVAYLGSLGPNNM